MGSVWLLGNLCLKWFILESNDFFLVKNIFCIIILYFCIFVFNGMFDCKLRSFVMYLFIYWCIFMYFLVIVLLYGICNNIFDLLKDLSKLMCNCN